MPTSGLTSQLVNSLVCQLAHMSIRPYVNFPMGQTTHMAQHNTLACCLNTFPDKVALWYVMKNIVFL